MRKLRKLLSKLKCQAVSTLINVLISAGFGRFFLVRIVELEKNKGSITGLTRYELIAPGRELRFTDPYYRDYLHRTKLFCDGVYFQKEVFACTIANAKLDVSTGVVCTADNSIIVESAMDSGRLETCSTYRRRIGHSKRRAGLCSTVWHAWGRNYYHWLIDCLPRTFALTKFRHEKDIQLLMPDVLKAYQKTALAFCVPDNVSIEYLGGDERLQADTILLNSFVTFKACGYMPPEPLEHVRRSLFKGFGLSGEHGMKNRIFISRKNALRRRLLNEPEIFEYLEPYGFVSYALEALSFEEQVRLFHDAAMVVAPHGAGFSNLVFSGRVKVLDLFPTAEPDPHFFFLSQALQQKYYYTLSEETSKASNFHVKLDDFKAAFSRMMDG